MKRKPKLVFTGDVITLKDGMKVYAPIPKMFVFSNRRDSMELYVHDIIVGHKYTNISSKGKNHSFTFKGGDFLVINTNSEGGGYQHSPNGHPNGHRVSCKRLVDGKYDPKQKTINFYQTGSFTAMIPKIKPVRKMVQTFI
jgi:hypothetical protein